MTRTARLLPVALALVAALVAALLATVLPARAATPDVQPRAAATLTGRVAASSTLDSAHAPARAFDGSPTTGWAARPGGTQWLRVDLGHLYALRSVTQTFAGQALWHFRVEGSVDGTRWATLLDRSAGGSGRTFAATVEGSYRYVRLTVTGGSASSQELAISGTDRGADIAQGRTVSASTQAKSYEAANAVDGNTSTYWGASSADLPQWLEVDLGAPSQVTGVSQSFKDDDTYGFRIQASLDNTHWTTLRDARSGVRGETFDQRASGTWRYVRLTVLSSASGFWAGSTEFAVYGFADLARKAATTASSQVTGHDASAATDGSAATWWSAAGRTGSLTVDLGGLSLVREVQQSFVDSRRWTVTIAGSTDNRRWTTLLRRSATGRTFTATANAQARYVRLTVTGGGTPTSRELSVLGAPIERNLARGVSATSSSFGGGDFEPANAVDGDPTTPWVASGPTGTQTLTLDLGNVSVVDRLRQSFGNADTWRFSIAGSTDKEHWTTLLDRSAGAQGETFEAAVAGRYRYLRLTVLGSANGHWAASEELGVYGVGSPVTDKWWQDTSGVLRYYMKYRHYTLKGVTADLPTLKNEGFNAIELTTLPKSELEPYAGLAETDIFDVNPEMGTLADLDHLIKVAHGMGIRVLFFGNLGYASNKAPFFTKAQQDYKNNVDSPERRWFDFRSAPDPNHGPCQAQYAPGWFKSSIAKVYYYGCWGSDAPSYNWDNKAWRDEATTYIRFWMDHGFDGMALDAVGAYDGITQATNNATITDLLHSYDTWSNPEGSGGPDPVTGWHYTSIQDYNITNWADPNASGLIPTIEANDPDPLEGILKGNRDAINAVEGITQTAPSWERSDIDAGGDAHKRLLEIATLTTMGTFFYLHNGDYHILPQDSVIAKWKPQDRETLYALLRAQGSYPALAPSGARFKVPTNDNHRFYAYVRNDRRGGSKALVVENFQKSAQRVTVDLTGTGIGTHQTPVDLLGGTATPPITSGSYSVTLPAYGFAVLGVR